jgi:3-oxoacyl-[acyl-carrier protein] reductase
MENNYVAPLLLTQLVSRLISRSGEGSILFLSSISGMSSEFGSTAYGGSKAALSHAVGVLARELASQHIRVNALAPGVVNTEMKTVANEATWQKIIDRTFLKRMAEPEEIAYVAVFLISDKASYITGQTLRVDGGM